MITTKIIEILKNGGVGVVPTDTIYGLVGSAFFQKTVERVYKVKGRDLKKPLIILISSLEDLEKFGIEVDKKIKLFLQKVWPGKVSVILPLVNSNFDYLSRGSNSLAFRLPDNEKLISLLEKTGPSVAPSANPEGLDPAGNIKKAKEYFGEKVDFYLDGGELKSLSSTLVEIKGGEVKVLREGEDIKKVLGFGDEI